MNGSSGPPLPSSPPLPAGAPEFWLRAIQASVNAIALATPEGRLTFVNPSFLRLWGYGDPAEVLRRDAGELWASGISAADVGAARGERCGWSGATTAKRRDGGLFPVQLSATVVHDGAGNPTAVVASFVDLTERVQAEEKLRERGRQFTESQRIAQIGSWERNLKTGEVRWSDELFRLLGLDPLRDRADFATLLAMIVPEDRAALTAAIEETVRTGKHYSMDYRLVLRDGRSRIMHAQAELTYANDGTEAVLSGTAQDVTEHRMAQLAVEASERKFRALFNSVTDSILIHDLQGRFLEVNDAICNLLGYSREELLRMSPSEIDTPEAARKVPANLARILERGALRFESEQLSRDGRRIPVEVSARIFDFAGREAIVSVCRDVTERAEAERLLRESEGKYRELVETANSIILTWDTEGRILFMNRFGERFFGFTREELAGRNVVGTIVPPAESSGRDLAALMREIQCDPERFLDNENENVTREGRRVWVRWANKAITDRGGKLVGILSIGNDATERRLLFEERLKTQKLESIGTLAGGIAHDFNNLLHGIFGCIAMAKQTLDEPGKALADLEQAEEAFHQAVSLTNQLLTFSRGGTPVVKRFPLLPAIEKAARFALSGSRCDHSIATGADLWQAEADEGQIGQVFQNIVLNAAQAMPQGGSVTIEARNVPAGSDQRPPTLARRDYVRLSIRDSGQGIAEQHLTRIFDPYFTTKEHGSGLGLATCYSIMRNHGGLIEVQSAVGRGSTFVLYVPATREAARPPRREEPRGAEARGRLLVMDDEALVRQLALRMLSKLGHSAAFAENGEQALALYREALASGQPFDAVILDLTIRGGMGGEETMARLLELDPSVRAVVSSGYSDDAALANFGKLGFTAFLKKPFNLAELRKTLQAVLA